MADLNKNLAPKFNASTSYDLGDVVSIDNKLYAYCGKADGFKEVYLADLVRGKAESKLNLEPVLLWENASPTSAFAAQTIPLDLSEYSGVIVEFNYSVWDGYQYLCSRQYVKIGESNFSTGVGNEGSNATFRKFNVNSDGVEFKSSYTNTSVSNNGNIPYRIYGVKGVIIEKKTTLEEAPTLLWTNSNPTSAFAGQTVALDLSEYSGAVVEFRTHKDTTAIGSKIYLKLNEDATGCGYTGDYPYSRNLSATINKVTFADCYGASNVVSNNLLIPYKIYGVKTDLVEYTETCEPLTEYLVEKGAEESEVDTVENIKTYLNSNLGGKNFRLYVIGSGAGGSGSAASSIGYYDSDDNTYTQRPLENSVRFTDEYVSIFNNINGGSTFTILKDFTGQYNLTANSVNYVEVGNISAKEVISSTPAYRYIYGIILIYLE